MGTDHLENYLRARGRRASRRSAISIPHARRARAKEGGRRRPAQPDAVHEGRPRFRADVRRRAARSGLQRHAVGMARARDAGRPQDRQARGHGSAGGLSRGRLLGARRSGREIQEARRDDGELLLRPARDAGADAGAQGHARASSCTPSAATCTTCAGSSSRRRARASGGARTPSSATATCTRRTASGPIAQCFDINRGNQFELPRLDEQPVARPAALERARSCRPTIRARARSTSWATSTSA